ncbi:hypothetical protein ES702_04446 [subsurface metagenome]
MKNKWRILNIILIGIFLSFFFLKVFPIPVENKAGLDDPDNFIFGGFYYTSILYQFSVGNNFGAFGMVFIFIIIGTGGNLILIKNKKIGEMNDSRRMA